MIVRLQPEQLSIMWDTIKFAVLEANDLAKSQAPLFINEVLEMLLGGKAQAWLLYEDKDGERTLYTVVVTCYMEEPLLGFKYLLIHSVYAYQPLSLDKIREALEAFEDFARANGAGKVVTMTKDERLVKGFERLGMQREVFVYSKTV